MNQFGNILHECRKILAGNPNFLASLDNLARDLERESFNVCIVGGFSHGKTRLLNELLGTDIFPENALPATTVLTKVSYGEKAALSFVGSQEKTEYEPCRENLEMFCAGNAREDAQGLLLAKYPAKFLKPSTVLVDTPGLDDLLTSRADIAFSALENCEAALVLVSAIAPLSINEKTFIESYLAGRSIPKIAIVVSFLDKLNPRQAARQMDYIGKIAKESWPDIEIWTCMPENGDWQASGPEAMRKRIAAWAQDPGLEKLRAKQYGAKLAAILNEVLAEKSAMLANLEADRQAREKKLLQDIDALSANAEGWRDLRRKFMDQAPVRAREIQKTLKGKAEKTYNLALRDSRQSFEAALRLNLQGIVAEISQDMQKGIHDDIENLMADIRGRYGFEPMLREEALQINPDYEQINLPGANPLHGLLDQIKGMDKVLVDKMVVILPLPPIARPILQQIAHWLLDFGKGLLRDNPAEHEAEIKAEIGKFFSTLESQTVMLIESLYDHIAEQVRHEQDAWLKRQKMVLEAASRDHGREAEIAACRGNMADVQNILKTLGTWENR